MNCFVLGRAGLYNKYAAERDRSIGQGLGTDQSCRAARQLIIQLFGGNLTAVATGGAKTPRLHLDFAKEVNNQTCFAALDRLFLERCATMHNARLWIRTARLSAAWSHQTEDN